MGFLRTGTDVQQLIHTGEMIMRYLGCVSSLLVISGKSSKTVYL
jgi:hypothetical protein